MKTLKYRSVFGVLATAALSVFLFTACEKESDNTPTKPDRLSKFKSLTFSGGTASTTTNSGSGTFIGNNNNVTFTSSATGAGNNETQFAPAAGNDNDFTDPTSTESNFVVENGFTLGGGTVSLGQNSYDLDFGFCASSDFFGTASEIGQGGSSTSDNLEVFIGVSGDFEFEMAGEDEAEDLGINLLLYVFSSNGATNIGDFSSFEEGDIENAAFVIAVEFDDSMEDFEGNFYFSTSGSVDFSGSNVTLSGVQMTKVNFGQFAELSSTTTSLQAFLECGSYNFEEEEEAR